MKDSNLGFWEILCLILITLRLTDQIDWWWGWIVLMGLGKYIIGYAFLIIKWILEYRK